MIAKLARGNLEDVDRAVKAARKAFKEEWVTWKSYERQRLLVRVLDLLERNFDELARPETTDMGAPLSRTKNLKTWLLQAIMFYVTQTINTSGDILQNSLVGNFFTHTIKAPIGVVGGIIPWNGPLISQWWLLGPVLATGCTLALKPAEDAFLTVLCMAELLAEAGLPPGVVNVITGLGHEPGAALAAHQDVDRIALRDPLKPAAKSPRPQPAI